MRRPKLPGFLYRNGQVLQLDSFGQVIRLKYSHQTGKVDRKKGYQHFSAALETLQRCIGQGDN
jgi:hypothetical protein